MQLSFASAQFSSKKKQTRRDRLLADLEQLVPWSALVAVIEPHYPKTDVSVRPSHIDQTAVIPVQLFQLASYAVAAVG